MSDSVCDNCGSKDAIMKVTQMLSDEMTLIHLCEKCAAEKGLGSVPDQVNFPLTDLLSKISEETVEEGGSSESECSFCGLTMRDFRDTGRLGCPHCYETFYTHLRKLLRRIHGAVQHVGKVYLPPDPTASQMEGRLEGLRRKLNRAVESEDFERAAELRDQIRSLEPA